MCINLPWLWQNFLFAQLFRKSFTQSSHCAYMKPFSAIFMAYINVLAQNGLKTARIRARLTWITLKWPILRESFHKVRRPDECWSVSVVTSAQQSHQTLYSCLCLPGLTLWLLKTLLGISNMAKSFTQLLSDVDQAWCSAESTFIPVNNSHLFVCFHVRILVFTIEYQRRTITKYIYLST